MKTMIRNMAIVMLLVQGGLSAVVGKVGGKVVTGGSDATGVVRLTPLTENQYAVLTSAEKTKLDKLAADHKDLKDAAAERVKAAAAKVRARKATATTTTTKLPTRTEKDGFPVKAVKAK